MTDIKDPDAAYLWQGRLNRIADGEPFLRGYATSVWAKTHEVAKGFSIDQRASAYLEAGALAVRALGDIPAGLAHWRGVRLVVQAFEESLEVRQRDAEHYTPGGPEGTFFAGRFPEVQQCLVLAGLHQEWMNFRRHFDSPYVALDGGSGYSAYAAEAQMHYAAWDGDMGVWQTAEPVIRKEYTRYKYSPVYFDLWAAVIQRDAAKLDSLLPEAEAAWKASRRRRNPDLWGGGGKVYNEFMIDRYTTTLLKIARRLGLQWQYRSKVSEQLWPEAVITHWED